MNILLGIVLIVIGICIAAFSPHLMDLTGRWTRADRNLGGTTQGFVIIGFLFILFGSFVMFGGDLSNDTPMTFPVAE